MEHLRSIEITIEVDTNKRSEKEVLTLGEHDEDETTTGLLRRVEEWLEEQGLK
jgi:hypothetical protein